MNWVQKVGAREYWRKIRLYGHSGAILNTFQIDVEFITLWKQKGCMKMPNFQNLLVLTISNDENTPINLLKPTPEASPVLTLGKDSKGRVRTTNTTPTTTSITHHHHNQHHNNHQHHHHLWCLHFVAKLSQFQIFFRKFFFHFGQIQWSSRFFNSQDDGF